LNIYQAIAAAGMTPPNTIIPGRWVRFPGIGKGKSNRAGWCRLIAPTMAIFGDWSTGVSEIWRDDAHRDDEASAKLLRDAQTRERKFAAEQRARQHEAAQKAQDLIDAAQTSTHPYLHRKGFGHVLGLVFGEHLLIPVRDVYDYNLISLQQINPDGEKRFLHGSRARGGIYRIGARGKTFLCEGYATGLSLFEAAKRLHKNPSIIVCFSAGNIETVASKFPQAVIAADHDASGVGERVARKTGLPWVMPKECGFDFNDLHRAEGLHAVVGVLRNAK
jgi:putative DNA primase/helicase